MRQGILRKDGFWFGVRGAVALLASSMLVSAAFCEAPALPWHLREWTLRQIVRMEVFGAKPWGNTILAEFHAAPPLLAADGRDVRVVDEKGRPVRYQWVNEEGEVETDPFGKGKRPLLHLELTDPEVTTYAIYFGNPDAPAETHTWEKIALALMLETRMCPEGAVPKTWGEMTKLLARSNFSYGEGRRRQINDSENPYGPDERFISIYNGMLNCPAKGEYGFATDSDDASFLLIDGMPVIQWAGGHPPSGKFDHYATIKLTAAPHRIQYYLVQAGGGALAKAGWRLPGATEFETIPEEAFIRENPTRVMAMEHRDSPLNAFFTAHVEGALQFGSAGLVFTTVRFEDLSRSSVSKVTAWEWNLGDGRISRERNPSHVYRGAKRYEIALKCIDELGYESTWKRRLSLDTERVTRADIAMELTAEQVFALPNEPIRAGIKFRNTSNTPLETTLVTEIRISPTSVLKTDREELALQPGRWLAREASAGQNGEVFFDTGDIAFHLEYRGESVASRRIVVCRAADPGPALHVAQGKLLNDEDAAVVLRLSGRTGERQGLSLVERLKSGESVNIVTVDAALLGSASSNYLTDLAALLKERFPRATVNVSHFDPEDGGSRSDAALCGIVDIGDELAKLKPDLVILPGSLRDVLRFTPTDRFKRMFHARVDRIRARTQTDILLLAQPPTIANPKLAQDYAMRVKEIGMLRGLPVADAFSAFMTASGTTSATGGNDDRPWRQYYRDPDSDAPMYYVAPALQGQRLIAETLLAVILSEKPPK